MNGRTLTRAGAVAGATAMTAATLAVVGAGTAQAAPVSATGGSEQMTFTRTVSEGVVAHGDVVTVTTTIERKSANAWMLTWFRDQHPTCMDLVPDSVEWTVSGDTYTQETDGDEVFVSDDALVVDNPGIDVWNPPLTVTADYTVNCAAGRLPTGGVEWNRTQWNIFSPLNEEFLTSGPSITVEHAETSLALGPVSGARVTQPVTLTASATGIPDGQTVTFHDGGVQIGLGTVTDGTVSTEWTPATTGSRTIEARFAGNATHEAARSSQQVTVGQAPVSSSVVLAPVPDAQVGRGTELVAQVTPSGAGGTVAFSVGGTVVGTAPVGADGRARYTWSPTSAGSQEVTAVFSGRDGVLGSQASRTVQVAEQSPTAVASTTTLDAAGPGTVGQELTLTAHVSPANAGGVVTFLDNGVVIGTATVGADGAATLRWTPASAGERTITAEYAGAGDVLASEGTSRVLVNEPEPSSGSVDLGSLGSSGGTGSLGS